MYLYTVTYTCVYIIFMFVSMDTLEYVIPPPGPTRSAPCRAASAGGRDLAMGDFTIFHHEIYAFFRAEKLKGTCLHIYIYIL